MEFREYLKNLPRINRGGGNIKAIALVGDHIFTNDELIDFSVDDLQRLSQMEGYLKLYPEVDEIEFSRMLEGITLIAYRKLQKNYRHKGCFVEDLRCEGAMYIALDYSNARGIEKKYQELNKMERSLNRKEKRYDK